jgi:hypothetical protein
MIAKNLKLLTDFNGNVTLSIDIPNKTDAKALQELTGVDLLELSLKKYRKSKTLTQIGALHVLCNEIAIKLNSTKLEIYKHAVREVGEFILVPVPNDEVEKWSKNWCINSDSAQCVELRDSKLEGYKVLQCYYSVASYNTKEMSTLINYVVDEAEAQGIFLMTREEISKLKN